MGTFITYKPYGMLSQFTPEKPDQVTLSDLKFKFEKDVYPIGRLDANSEGLLILSSDKKLNQKLLNPKSKEPKLYWVQVEGYPEDSGLEKLRQGITITVKGKSYNTEPAKVRILEEAPNLPDRNPPIRVRKSIPDTWVSISIYEGKNRQIRRMFAAINNPVLRLVRVGIAGFKYDHGPLTALAPGAVRELPIE